jgi:thiol-disulfide isomerase/thioredoxin
VLTTDGQVFKLGAQRGHVVVINYWATWCGACLDEMPMLRKFAASHPSVKLIGLTYEKITPDALRQFAATHGIGYPVAHIDPSKIPHALKPTWFGMHALPLTYVLSPQGTVTERWVGELSVSKLQEVVGQR